MERVRVVASGRVQGVFFRAATADEARRRGITGWVRNTADGRVSAEFQGSPDAVAALVEFCRAGPGSAEVECLDVAPVDPVPDETAFTVRP